MRMPAHQPLPETPVIGRKYPRPCVRTRWVSVRIGWIPVLGSVHRDREYVGADFSHVHVDYRFLSEAARATLESEMSITRRAIQINQVHSTPITYVWPDEMDHAVDVEDAPRLDIKTESWLQIRKVTYRGPYPTYPPHVQWIDELSAAFQEARLGLSRICAHQGTELSGFVPEADGTITCPLHGLRWDVATGRLVMPDASPETAHTM